MKFTNEICVFFLTTINEYKSGDLVKSLNCYLSNCESKYKFDIIIVFDTTDGIKNSYSKEFCKIESEYKNVRNIFILSNQLSKDENFYDMSLLNKVDLEKYPMGASHGINLHFYNTLDKLLKLNYRSFLLLESDTKPIKSDWFDVILNYTRNNKFLIAGSLYKGVDKDAILKSYFGGHLNGVAIYKNSSNLQRMLLNSKIFLINSIKNDKTNMYFRFMNYDVAIYLYLKSQNSVEASLLDTNFITNMSSSPNNELMLENIINDYPDTRILHKKNLYK
jgi:hypothetical protein